MKRMDVVIKVKRIVIREEKIILFMTYEDEQKEEAEWIETEEQLQQDE
jgi:hypothetical protein